MGRVGAGGPVAIVSSGSLMCVCVLGWGRGRGIIHRMQSFKCVGERCRCPLAHGDSLPHPCLTARATSLNAAPFSLGEVTDSGPGLEGSNHLLARLPKLVI